MQQRQLRLGDILDDYCPRERRVTNHVIVAMIGEDVKQVRCTTCDADHDFKHAKVPRQRRKVETPAALYAQVLATGPKRVTHESAQTADPASAVDVNETSEEQPVESPAPVIEVAAAPEPERVEAQSADEGDTDEGADADGRAEEEGPVHRPLIRASLPRIDGAPPPSRQIPEFTIRQPGGRPTNRFRPRHQRGVGGGGGGGQQFQGNRPHGGGNVPGGPRGPRSNGGRPPQGPGGAQMRRHGPGRKRSK
jgi:hypothetical protein